MADVEDLFKKLMGSKDDFEKAREQFAAKEYKGSTAAGMVVVIIDGKYEMKSIKIEPEILKMEREVIEDLIKAAYNDARRKVNEDAGGGITDLLSRLGIPANFDGLI
ncbi:nucleoid-associated protein [Rickettsiales bacterium]|nr:nucleoid-associated protein [Rickettsiales bacterium]